MWNVGRSKLSGSLPSAIKSRIYARIGIVAEEADEAVMWIELLTESGIVKPEALLKEAKELAAILTASQQTAKKSA